jgi:MFS family permease
MERWRPAERGRVPPVVGPAVHRRVRIAGLIGTSFGDVARPLAGAQFRWLWLSTFAWNFARWMEMTVVGWVALELTGSAWLVALVGVCRSAFLPIAGPLTGAMSDRFDRVRLIKVSQWGNVLVIGAVAAALVTGHGAYWQLILAALWLGASWGVDWPSRRALSADLVGPGMVLPAVLLDNVTQNVSRIAGPLLGGYLLATVGGPGAFVALALCFLLASTVLVPLRPVPQTRVATGASVWRDLAAGLAYVRRDPAMWGVLAITVAMNTMLFPYQQLLSIFAEQVLFVGPIGLGYLGAANGVGAFLGLLVLPLLRGRRWQGRAFVGGSCLGCLALLLFATSTWFPLALAFLLITGLGTSAFATMQSTIMLSRAEPAMRGRAMGLVALAIGSAPLGALEIGALVEWLGAPAAVALNTGLCGLLVAAVGWRTGLLAPPRRGPQPAVTAEAGRG